MFINLIHANLTTDKLGRKIEHFLRTDSTNNDAQELALDGAEEGTLVIADHQTSGKGRDGRKWLSVAGKSLTISIILKPGMHSYFTGWFPLMAGVAVREALAGLGLNSGLKWPNDILYLGKKLGGILCESSLKGHRLEQMIMGIGLNVNENENDLFDSTQATSYFLSTLRTIQPELVIAGILNKLEPLYRQMQDSQDFTTVKKLWTEHCCHIQKSVTFTSKNESQSGIFIGLDDRGAALVNIHNITKTYHSGDIHFLN